ncbi:MAG: hypothetical protein NXY59_02175 [Aigarchaeota archaeon]|nr:hypothetical protein [Candidatus Pelearchaeum maunauluense]
MRPKVIEGYEKHGPTKWGSWQRFTFSDMRRVLENAVKYRLVGRSWIRLVKR